MKLSFRPLVTWPGVPTKKRADGQFRVDYHTLQADLENELRHLRASEAIISLAIQASEIRRDGMPYAKCRPTHPGVVLNVQRQPRPIQIACDTYRDWQDNLRAISLTLTALRAVRRYGCAQHDEPYKGYEALPPGETQESSQALLPESPEWAAALIADAARCGVSAKAVLESVEIFKGAYRAASLNLHPDRGGDHEAFVRLQRAADILKKRHHLT